MQKMRDFPSFKSACEASLGSPHTAAQHLKSLEVMWSEDVYHASLLLEVLGALAALLAEMMTAPFVTRWPPSRAINFFGETLAIVNKTLSPNYALTVSTWTTCALCASPFSLWTLL